jgi:hypothetical protein
MKNFQFKTPFNNLLYTAVDTTKDPVIVLWVQGHENKRLPVSSEIFHGHLLRGTYMAASGKKAHGNVRKRKSTNLFSIDEL